jgi:lysophospholipase L1-like esterase
MRRLKTVVFYAVMVGLSIGICFAVLEYVFARFYYSDVYVSKHLVPDPVTGWMAKPGTFKFKPVSSLRKHDISINGLGLRNESVSLTAEADLKRIIILGDSFTFGISTPSEKTFPVILEAMLNHNEGSDSIEVINGGIPGFGTGQQLLLMRKLADEGIVADLYVLMFFCNDILDNLGLLYYTLTPNIRQPTFGLDDHGELYLKYSPPVPASSAQPDDEDAAVLGRTRLGLVLRLTLESFLQTKPSLVRVLSGLGIEVECPTMPGIISGWYRQGILHRGTPLTRALLREVRNEAERNDAKIIIAFIPSNLQVYFETYGPLLESTFPDSAGVDAWIDDPNRPQRIVAGICKDLGIPFFDLLPPMRDANDKAQYIPRDAHFSSTGHSVVADHLACFITEHME